MICGLQMRTPGRPVGLDAMLATLPGGESTTCGAWTDGTAGLGWRGDPDLRPGRRDLLPRIEGATGLAVTASVRLDDRTALCCALGIPPGQHPKPPDSVLLLRAYERWGAECPNHLLGDFAFAVWDGRRRTLFLTRDHVGTRPLFYSLSAERVVFASDVGAVLAVPGVSDALDEAAVAMVLGRELHPLGEHTYYRAVRRLPPGHTLTIAGASTRVTRWWRPEDVPAASTADDDTVAEAFLDLYARAVEDRTREVSRVGVHLSGGLDSSSVAALAARAGRRAGHASPPGFSWHAPPNGIPDGAPEAREHRMIDAVRRAHGMEVFFCPLDAAAMLDYLRRDGTRDAVLVPNEAPVQRCAARHGVRVLLSGWGGDEGISYNGRGYEAGLLREARLVALWRFMRENSRHPFAATILRAAVPLCWPKAGQILVDLRQGRRTGRGPGFIHPGFARRARPVPAPTEPRGGVQRHQLQLLRLGHLAERMDEWAASGAHHGIEYGYPLLDRRVLEFALALPPEQYRRGRVNRWLMRHALGALLPAEVCRNLDKREPVRGESLLSALDGALPAVRRILETRSSPPSRSTYCDMPRLTAHLDAARFRATEDPWLAQRVMCALCFLDF